MQIGSLLNVLASSPAALALNAAQGGPNAALTSNGVANTGALTDALVTQAPATNPWAQFAALLSGNASTTALTTPGANGLTPATLPADEKKDPATDTQNPTQAGNVANNLTPASGIAVPPIGLYIDQTPNQNVVLTTNSNTIDANSKKLVFTDPADAAKPVVTSNASLANEVYHTARDARAAAIKAGATDNQGKIKLANLDSKAVPADDEDFHQAFNNIVEQANTKTAPAKQAAQVQAKVVDVQTTDANGKIITAAKDSNIDALAQPQTIAGKISAKVVGIKEDKVALDTDVNTNAMNIKLQDFDSQLRARNYTQIKEVASTLPQTATEQVQVKISQAMDTGLNSIKINLHPAELGAVDVDMNTDKDGKTSIRIIADKADTLQMLRHDSEHLVKSLSDVGVKADSSSLQFSLRGDQQNQNFAQNQNNGAAMNSNQQNNQQQASAATATYSRFTDLNEQNLTLSVQNNGLNILV